MNSPPQFTQTTLRKTLKKQTKFKRPFTSLKIAQVAPKGPKTYPGSSRDPPELSEGSPGPPGRPASHETYGKSQKTNKII